MSRFLQTSLAGIACSAMLAAANADLILHNGKIVTVDKAFSISQAIAIKDGRVTAVGTDSAVLKAERSSRTNVVDLQGRTALPGLFDSHVHALEAGLSEFRGPFPELHSFADVQQYVRSQMRTTPKGQWIVVPRTFPTRLREMRMPTRDVLDVAAEHPVMFDASYVVIANSYGAERNPQIHIRRPAKLRPHDTDHVMGLLVKLDGSAENSGVLSEQPFPGSERQHGHLVRVRLVFLGLEGASDTGLRTEDVEPAQRYVRPLQALGYAGAGIVEIAFSQDRGRLKQLPAVLHVGEVRNGGSDAFQRQPVVLDA